MDTQEELMSSLEMDWEEDGFFGRLRHGDFSDTSAQKFLWKLKSISQDDETRISKRLVSLLWYAPIFLEWQRERVGQNDEYDRFATEVCNLLENILGVP
jgi:hypothetical protein